MICRTDAGCADIFVAVRRRRDAPVNRAKVFQAVRNGGFHLLSGMPSPPTRVVARVRVRCRQLAGERLFTPLIPSSFSRGLPGSTADRAVVGPVSQEKLHARSHLSQFALITLAAAVVNGALGYGFSSITVPLALLFTTSRVLNPALVLVELVLNGYVLFVNRAALLGRPAPHDAARCIGLVPGVAAGTLGRCAGAA